MQQLSAFEASILYGEESSNPLHTCGFSIYNQSTVDGGRIGHKDILAYIEKRLPMAPRLCRRLVKVPFDVDYPYWAEDPNFDLEFHIRHIALPKPGDWRQLCILISRINSRQLDFQRPLWEAYVIEGLNNVQGMPPGCFALFTKVHNTMLGQDHGEEIFRVFHDESPDAGDLTRDKGKRRRLGEEPPSSMDMLVKALPRQLTQPAKGLLRLGRELTDFALDSLEDYANEKQPPVAGNSMATRFARKATAHRVFEGTVFPRKQFEKLQQRFGVSLNDIAAATCAGGLARYFAHHQERYAGGLSLDLTELATLENEEAASRPGTARQKIALHAHINDPVKRLAAIHADALREDMKVRKADFTQYALDELPGLVPPILGKSYQRVQGRYLNMNRAEEANSGIALAIIYGPDEKLYHVGARMAAYWGLPALPVGTGLGHCVFVYRRTVSLSISAGRDLLPDPAFYRQCCVEAFNELLALAPIDDAEETGSTKPAGEIAGSVSGAIDESRVKAKQAAAAVKTSPGRTAKSKTGAGKKVAPKQRVKKVTTAQTTRDKTQDDSTGKTEKTGNVPGIAGSMTPVSVGKKAKPKLSGKDGAAAKPSRASELAEPGTNAAEHLRQQARVADRKKKLQSLTSRKPATRNKPETRLTTAPPKEEKVAELDAVE